MTRKESIAQLRTFAGRLVSDRIRDSKGWRQWRDDPSNAAFMASCLAYKAEEGMPAVTALVDPHFHPELPLVGLNYTDTAHRLLHRFENGWTAPIKQCRGIVFDRRSKLVALPFDKFFNYGETHGMSLPDEPWEATEKEDGHLLISAWYRDELFSTTRGSFVSPTALIASELLKPCGQSWQGKLPKHVTLLTEFIHPETEVHLDYNGLIENRVIGANDTATCSDFDYAAITKLAHDLALPVVKRWTGNSLAELMALVKDPVFRNREGFVVRFASGLRVKFKFKGYVGRMIEDKLNPVYVMNQLMTGSYDGKMSDMPGEVQMAADEIKGKVMRVASVKGDKKTQCDFLYGMFSEKELTPYRKTICRKFHTWLEESGKIVVDATPVESLTKPKVSKPKSKVAKSETDAKPKSKVSKSESDAKPKSRKPKVAA